MSAPRVAYVTCTTWGSTVLGDKSSWKSCTLSIVSCWGSLFFFHEIIAPVAAYSLCFTFRRPCIYHSRTSFPFFFTSAPIPFALVRKPSATLVAIWRMAWIGSGRHRHCLSTFRSFSFLPWFFGLLCLKFKRLWRCLLYWSDGLAHRLFDSFSNSFLSCYFCSVDTC